MVLRVKIRLGQPVPAAGMFTSITQSPARGWLPLAFSFVLHAAAISGAIFYFDSTRHAVESLASRYSLRLIRLRPPTVPQPHAPGSAGGLANSSGDHPAAPRRFEFVKLPVPAQSAQILLQPDIPVSTPLKVDSRVPELLLWKPHPALPAVPPRKIFVAHRKPEDPARPNFPEPPALDTPNNEPQVTDLASSGHSANLSPLFAPPPGTTAPIRTQAPGGSAPIPQIAPSLSNEPDNLNVLSIPEIPVPPAGVFQLPPGNQAGPSGSSSGGLAGQSGNPAGAGNSGAPGQSAAAVTGAASASATAGTGREASRGSGLSSGQAIPEPVAERNVTKVVLPPDGHFGVLVESSGSEASAEAEGILSGKVVYTAYVRAGARKEWILQYCLPETVERTLPVTGKAAPLEAPFPYLIMRPDLAFGPDIDYLIVHGIVTALGKLDQLSYVIAPEEQAAKDLLLHSLQQWQFRPGKLNSQPVALEILLLIPSDRE